MLKTKTMIISVVIILLNIFVLSLIILKTQGRNVPSDIKCVSETVTKKEYSSGRFFTSKLTTLVFLQGRFMTLIYKGAIANENQQYQVDRTMTLSVARIGNSKIYHVFNKNVDKTADDTTPSELFDSIQLDSLDYFYVTKVQDNAYIIHGLVLPVMTCTAF